MKSQVMAVLVAQVLVFSGVFAQAAQARGADLLTQALNQSLQERANLQKSYKENKKAAQAEDRSSSRPAETSIAIEVGDDLGSGSGAGYAALHADRSEERAEREDISRLDQELKEVDRTLESSHPSFDQHDSDPLKY